MQPPYIPSTDADFQSWFLNFSTLLTASPTTYGLVSGDATAVAAKYTDWHAKYLLAVNPATRTTPTIADKDAARILSTALLRQYGVQISRNPAVTNGAKTAIGVNLPNSARTPVPPPVTVPALSLVQAIHFMHTLAYYDTSTPTQKAKPPGAIGLELVRTLAMTPSSDPFAATSIATLTKSPAQIGYDSGDVGKTATYWGRWVTRSGPGGQTQAGPFGAPLVVVVI